MNKSPRLSQDIAFSLILAVVTMALYWRVVDHDFVNYDDALYVTENTHVQEGLTWKNFGWAFSTLDVSNWQPVTWLSHMLDVSLYGMKPGGHHVTSLLLHVFNSVLLFLVLKRMTAAAGASLLVAALFAWHPLHVESVAWVAERKDVLSTFFMLLSLGAYVRYAEQGRRGHYLLALACFGLGLMSKAMVVTLPCVLLLLDYWPLGRMDEGETGAPLAQPRFSWRRCRALLLEKVPFFALTAASSLLTVLAQQSSGALRPLEDGSIHYRTVNALVAYASYLWKTIWPADLAVFYPFEKSWPPAAILSSVLLLSAITALVVWWRQRRFLTVGWLWYLGTLVPVIGFVQVGSQSMADRYTYVPLLGVFIMVAWGAAQWASSRPRAQRALAGLAGIAVLCCLVRTSFQLENWQNCFALFDHALQVTKNNYVAHNNLAATLKTLGQTEQANVHYLEAVRIKPDYAMAHYNLAINLAEAGEVTNALNHFSEVVRLNKDSVEKRHTFGIALGRKGRWREAIDQFTVVLRREPGCTRARFNLAYACNETGQPLEAIAHYRAALRLQPGWPEAMQYLAWLLATTEGRTSSDGVEAIHLAEQLCSWTGQQSAPPLDVLAAACAQAGRFPEAVSAAGKASRLAADAGQKELSDQIQQRLQLYQSGRAYRVPTPTRSDRD